MNGLLVLDKPRDCTSHQAVEKLKKLLKIKKAGHTGTLDPFATGVLPVCFNKATKLIPYLNENKKMYQAEITLGVSTDTMDYTGNVVLEGSVEKIDKSKLEKVVSNFRGKSTQIPPMYSALKLKGKRLYKLARKGVEVERQPREIYINEIKLLEFNSPTANIYVECSKGTYIRSLAADIGNELGCGAHISALRRVGSGNFLVENSFNFDQIESGIYKVLSVSDILGDYKDLQINSDIAAMIKNGKQLSKSILSEVQLPNFNKMDIIKTLFNGNVISLSEALIDSTQFEYTEDKDIIFRHLRVLN